MKADASSLAVDFANMPGVRIVQPLQIKFTNAFCIATSCQCHYQGYSGFRIYLKANFDRASVNVGIARLGNSEAVPSLSLLAFTTGTV
jgi:hypothetical protein